MDREGYVGSVVRRWVELMEYRSVGNRCAVDIESLNLPISYEEALSILARKGFRVLNIDLIALARQCVISSAYRRGARPSEAPQVVDCSSFTKWLYGQRGIWLPRRSIQQREIGERVELNDAVAGDLVFVSGHIDYWLDDPKDGVGHVGIASGMDTIIHAANRRAGVIESPILDFVTEQKFRGVRRIIHDNERVVTLLTPKEREVETSDDIRWIIHQNLSVR